MNETVVKEKAHRRPYQYTQEDKFKKKETKQTNESKQQIDSNIFENATA